MNVNLDGRTVASSLGRGRLQAFQLMDLVGRTVCSRDGPGLLSIMVRGPDVRGTFRGRIVLIPDPFKGVFRRGATVGRIGGESIVAQVDVDISGRSISSSLGRGDLSLCDVGYGAGPYGECPYGE